MCVPHVPCFFAPHLSDLPKSHKSLYHRTLSGSPRAITLGLSATPSPADQRPRTKSGNAPVAADGQDDGYDEIQLRLFCMSATPTRTDRDAAADAGPAMHAGNRALESIARQEALRSLLAFSELHERIRNRRATVQPVSDDLTKTERFVLDEVLQLICDRALAVTGAHGVTIALAEGTQIVCRASSGSVLVERSDRFPIDSEFLAECLVSGQITRCDDAETDSRIRLDMMRKLGATSSVLVPLRGTNARLGVLQAFSRIPRGFNENAIRSLDLFAELVLSALKPEDQDRRINWLTDLATEVLQPKRAAAVAEAAKAAASQISVAAQPVPDAASPLIPKPAGPTKEISAELPTLSLLPFEHKTKSDPAEESGRTRWLPALAEFGSARPGLSVVLGLILIASLFAGGVWWGMQGSAKTSPASHSASTALAVASTATSSAGVATDNLMDPARFSPEAASATASNGKALPKITGVRHWSSEVGSTVVLDLDDQVQYEVHRLMSPERIYFDLHNTALAANLDGQNIDVGDAALARVRIAQPVPGVTRLVLDTRNGANFSVSMESNPYRLMIELRGNERSIAANSQSSLSGRLSAAISSALTPSKSLDERLAARTGKFRIVLDAGHGGWDLGTVGHEGVIEKDLVLDVTRRLGKLLETRLGSEVVFTRTTDDYLPLEDRADVANQAQADLFVSVHANYSSSVNARGVETYYSNFFAAPGSKEMVQHENENATKSVSVSMSANALQEKIEESRRLASSVQRSLYAALATKSPDIRNRGIKDSAFVVLTGTTMPAILTEISFVSSPADEHNLRSESYRQQIAEALYKGIARYEESAPHTKLAQLQRTAAR